MADFDFDAPIDRRGTGALKWDRYATQDVLPLWVADMDFASPPAVIGALHARVTHGVFGYTHAPESTNTEVCRYLERAHSVYVDGSALVWLPGCVPALSMACAAVGEPGDGVLSCIPVYPPFLEVHKDSRRELKTVSLSADAAGRYSIDFDALERAIDERPASKPMRVLLFCNPHNPVGRVFTRDEVERVADLCLRRDLLLCSDEIHCDLVLDEGKTPHFSALRLEGPIQDRLIVLMAASKTYNIAGLACAFGVIRDPKLRKRFIEAAGKMRPEISPLSFAATEAAYRDGEEWRLQLLAYLRENRKRIADLISLHCPQIILSPIEATFLAWLDVRQLGHADPHRHFERHGLGFSDGVQFGSPGFVRFNFGVTQATIDAALQRFRNAL